MRAKASLPVGKHVSPSMFKAQPGECKEYPKSPKYPGSIEPTTHMQMHQLSPPFARIVPGWLLFWELHQWDSLAYPYRTIHRGVATMLAQGISNISNTHIGRQSGCSFVFICLLSIWWDYVRRNYVVQTCNGTVDPATSSSGRPQNLNACHPLRWLCIRVHSCASSVTPVNTKLAVQWSFVAPPSSIQLDHLKNFGSSRPPLDVVIIVIVIDCFSRTFVSVAPGFLVIPGLSGLHWGFTAPAEAAFEVLDDVAGSSALPHHAAWPPWDAASPAILQDALERGLT